MKNRIQFNETTSVCCVCGGHISGPWPATRNLSHGYCEFHHQLAMQEICKHLARLDHQQPSEARAGVA